MQHSRFGPIWVLAAAASAAVACAPTPAAPAPAAPALGAPVAPAAPAAAPAPQRGGILAYASTTQVNSLHPFKLRGAVERRAGGPVYDSLLAYKYENGSFEVNYDVEPWLAERWEQPNPTTYVFSLRKGVKFHDGRPLTADDVVFTHEFIRNPANDFPIASLLTPVQRTEKVDDFTVRITAKEPSPFLLQRLADRNMFILPKHVIERGDDLAKVAIGTGPFKVKSFDADSRSEYVRNADYWQEGKPYLDGLLIHWTLDESTRLAALIAREIDLWAAPDKKQTETVLQTVRDVQVQRVTPVYGDALVMPLDRPPFNDVRVRRALHLALDREALIKTAAQGEGIINPPAMPGHKEGYAIPPADLIKLPGYRQPKDPDLAEAKRLLAEAGFPEGLKTTLLYDKRRSTESRLAEPLAGAVRRGGFDMELGGRDRPEYVKALRDRSYQIALDFTADMELNSRQYPYLHSKGSQNTMGLADPKLDAILEGIDKAMEKSEQKRLALELQRYLLETLYHIPTIEMPAYQVQQPWVRGYQADQAVSSFFEQPSTTNTWFDQEVRKKYKGS